MATDSGDDNARKPPRDWALASYASCIGIAVGLVIGLAAGSGLSGANQRLIDGLEAEIELYQAERSEWLQREAKLLAELRTGHAKNEAAEAPGVPAVAEPADERGVPRFISDWRTVARYAVDGQRTTETFHIGTDRWRVFLISLKGDPLIQLEAHRADGEIVAVVSGRAGDRSIVYSGPGDYYLTISGTNAMVHVDEPRDTTGSR